MNNIQKNLEAQEVIKRVLGKVITDVEFGNNEFFLDFDDGTTLKIFSSSVHEVSKDSGFDEDESILIGKKLTLVNLGYSYSVVHQQHTREVSFFTESDTFSIWFNHFHKTKKPFIYIEAETGTR